MRVVSLVPSWTETLMSWGVPVVGRTRFCIHPADSVQKLPVIGGTKKQDWQEIEALQPDIIVADKEENTRDVLGRSTAHYHVSHVEKVSDMPRELKAFSELFTKKFPELSIQENIQRDLLRWEKLLAEPPQFSGWQSLPGVIDWIKKPQAKIERVCYVIWKKPWMRVTGQTFIGSIFELMGMGGFIESHEKKYPTFDLDEFGEETLMLFSTEPYPFAKEVESLKSLKSPSALIDGEGYSWFGHRSLQFLEKLPSKPKNP